jgi:RNA polymerase sigma-70 factor (ECF subfamily)
MQPRSADDERLGRLMQAAQAGDGDAYLQLLQEITPRVRKMVARRRFGGSAAEREDLVQDVLLSLHVARASYDPARPFVPWLLAIVRHRLADAARRDARVAARARPVDVLVVTFAGAPANSFPEVVSDIPALKEAIRALPRGQRDAIELLKLRELSLKEAAAVSGASVGALKVAAHRAVASLRRMLAGHLPGSSLALASSGHRDADKAADVSQVKPRRSHRHKRAVE